MTDLVVDHAPALRAAFDRLATARIVFFAGLPGTGKSLLLHQLAHLAHARGRVVHLLQWDVVRPAFEARSAAARYPIVDGVTHAVIRRAVGLWVRGAIVRWTSQHAGPEHLLIGETPFVGNRFIELARREGDEAEGLLASPACRFVLPVPSRAVRAFLESERARRAAEPIHEREREDAPPAVLQALWRHLADVGRELGVGDGGAAYDPDVYRAVYARVMRHRPVDVLAIDTVLPTRALSVYDFAVPRRDVLPEAHEPDRFIAEVERRYPDPSALAREVERWWEV
ncbi:MAG: hypothetical protein HYU41_10265 [Candidatus Rokubacteria bacterium]|nr:hypothetical protein [Candidatus Rokubacteria bacterium]